LGFPAKRFNRDVGAYNAAAAAVMTAAGVAIDDLHAAALDGGGGRLLCPDGVHFTEDGYRVLARRVAECIAAALGSV
jgi:lysophospholipase L1-like esterase